MSAARVGDLSKSIRDVAEHHRDEIDAAIRAGSQAGGLEDAARAAGSALDRIAVALAEVTHSAADVNEAAATNGAALERVERALADVADAAAAHAASALQVAAAAEHQSAATAQVSSASAWMNSAASRMKNLISGLRT